MIRIYPRKHTLKLAEYFNRITTAHDKKTAFAE